MGSGFVRQAPLITEVAGGVYIGGFCVYGNATPAVRPAYTLLNQQQDSGIVIAGVKWS